MLFFLIYLLVICQVFVTTQYLPWPVGVETADEENAFGENLSGVVDQPGDVLWAVQNSPSRAYKLHYADGVWKKESSCGWEDGTTITYPNGTGSPDAEDVAKAEWFLSSFYVVSERNNENPDVSRLSILMYNDSICDGSVNLTAAIEWDLTQLLPAVAEDQGLEAITWVPDTHLLFRSFYDTQHGKQYDPEDYPNHGEGLFFVGIEDNGDIFVFALDHSTSRAKLITSFSSGQDAIAALDFDRETCYLWAVCDNTCAGRINIFELPTKSEVALGSESGIFRRLAGFERPDSMPNLSNQGFTVAVENNCTDSFQKFAVWADEGNTDNHSLRQYLIPCGRFLSELHN